MFLIYILFVLAVKVTPKFGGTSILRKMNKTEASPIRIESRSFVFETHLLFKS